jgi:hypothetical protein
MSHFQLHVIETSPSNRFAEIVCQMNERFLSQEQFEMQIDAICTEIAMAMKGKMDRLGTYFRLDDNLIFNFTYLTPDQIIQRLNKEPS